MVTQHRSHVVKTHTYVKLKAHHAKPYRKRHLGLLIFSIVALVLIGVVLLQYRYQIMSGFVTNKSFVSNLFPQTKAYDVTIQSSYGFNLKYDQKAFYASAISNDNGSLYIGAELSQQHAYTVVRIAPNFSSGTQSQATISALTLTLHPGVRVTKDSLDTAALQDGGIDPTKVTRLSTITSKLGGQTFQKNVWQSKQSPSLSPALMAQFVTYSGLVRGNVVTIVIGLGVRGMNELVYAPILTTLSFDTKTSYVAPPTDDISAKIRVSRSILDTITGTNVAAAASNAPDLTGSEKIAALYSPAVVKIYNAYCMDILIDGKAYKANFCSAASGSGFFVSQDGYVGTNGHVASEPPIDLLIEDAINTYSSKGDPSSFNYLVGLTDLRAADIPANATANQAVAIVVDALYKLDTHRFTATNNVDNLLVQVAPKNPDITALIQNTKDRKPYTSADSSVLKAKLVAADYRVNDGYDGFRASDVAIIKVVGANFPVVKLGTIDEAVQGADLSILGYPGNASDNGIVDSTSSQVTLTTGKVSSIKNAAGSSKKLIETVTTIGHGNSGGPALTDNGDVVGIATYTADGSGNGNGVFNYIRDIKDLTDLASTSNITFDTKSTTQAAWQQGIANFYSSHYSRSLKNFAVAEKLYPNDSRVAEFTAAAKKHIADGQDIVDFPLIPVLIASAIAFSGIGSGLFFITRHHRKHAIYRTAVAEGTVQPVGPGVTNQTVFVAPNGSTRSTAAIATTEDQLKE